MTFSIVTPSYNQLDWLQLCVASVRDQVEEKPEGGDLKPEGGEGSNETQTQVSGQSHQVSGLKSQVFPPLCVEHIIQDAGTPGIEEFAWEIGAEFYRDGVRIVDSSLPIADSGSETNQGEMAHGEQLPISNQQLRIKNYTCKVFSESDGGMYDAINRGLRRSSGELCAWLNCDEQYLPGTLQKVGARFQGNPNIEVLVGDTVLLDEDLEPRAYRKAVPPNRAYIQAFQLNLHSSSLFFHRSLLGKNHWLGDRFRSIGDAEWVAGLLDSGIEFCCLSSPLSTFVLGKENLSLNILSQKETELWRREMDLSVPERVKLKVMNLVHRFAAGVYFPRRAGVSIFTTADTAQRSSFPARWLDFRFRV